MAEQWGETASTSALGRVICLTATCSVLPCTNLESEAIHGIMSIVCPTPDCGGTEKGRL